MQLFLLGKQIRKRRRAMRLSQGSLAERARVSRATLDALENGRLGELGFIKVGRILSVLGLELRLQEAHLRRPTLEDLVNEDPDDQGVGGRR